MDIIRDVQLVMSKIFQILDTTIIFCFVMSKIIIFNGDFNDILDICSCKSLLMSKITVFAGRIGKETGSITLHLTSF